MRVTTRGVSSVTSASTKFGKDRVAATPPATFAAFTKACLRDSSVENDSALCCVAAKRQRIARLNLVIIYLNVECFLERKKGT